MRTETIVRQIKNNPAMIDAQNRYYSYFGWSVLSVQITDQKFAYEGNSYATTESTFISDGFGGYGSSNTTIHRQIVTEHIDYATITYQRDLDDPRIAKCAELENKTKAILTAGPTACLTDEESAYLAGHKVERWNGAKEADDSKANWLIVLLTVLAVYLLGVSVRAYLLTYYRSYWRREVSILFGSLLISSTWVVLYEIMKAKKSKVSHWLIGLLISVIFYYILRGWCSGICLSTIIFGAIVVFRVKKKKKQYDAETTARENFQKNQNEISSKRLEIENNARKRMNDKALALMEESKKILGMN